MFRDVTCMSCDKDNNIIEWDLRTHRQVHRLTEGSGHYRVFFDDSQIIGMWAGHFFVVRLALILTIRGF
jgi:hypothetical protein